MVTIFFFKMKKTFADKVIQFNNHLNFSEKLPADFKVLNPFQDNAETMQVMQAFYKKFYNDSLERKFIIGINPSRHGAGVTGVPFTDTKRLENVCGIKMQSAYTHEISSVFMYDMIQEFGGVHFFYKNFYINSPFPLAIIRKANNGNWLNANYYDDKKLFKAVKNFMIQSLKTHIGFGLNTNEAYILGKKNADFIHVLNKEAKLFKKLITLEHPRFIQQYKSKEKKLYINKYISVLGNSCAEYL